MVSFQNTEYFIPPKYPDEHQPIQDGYAVLFDIPPQENDPFFDQLVKHSDKLIYGSMTVTTVG